MRIAITGASGMLGTELVNVLVPQHEVYGLDLHNPAKVLSHARYEVIDITETQRAYKIISRINPELIIHAAADKDVDGGEKDKDTIFRINALGTRNIALAAQRFDASILYISTDYVFDGSKKEPYTEFDQPHPLSNYGWSKYWGELYVQWLVRRFYIVRTSRLFGGREGNFVQAILAKAQANQKLRVVDDQIGSPTYIVDLAQALAYLIKLQEEITTGLYGIWHITNSGSCSWYEFAQEIIKASGLRNTVEKISSQTLTQAPRPAYSVLDNYNWKLHGFPAQASWQDALKQYLTEGSSEHR